MHLLHSVRDSMRAQSAPSKKAPPRFTSGSIVRTWHPECGEPVRADLRHLGRKLIELLVFGRTMVAPGLPGAIVISRCKVTETAPAGPDLRLGTALRSGHIVWRSRRRRCRSPAQSS
jgi:hypothetical protein